MDESTSEKAGAGVRGACEAFSQVVDAVGEVFDGVRDLNLRERLKARIDELKTGLGRESRGGDCAGSTADPADPAVGLAADPVVHRPAHYGSKSGQDVIDVAEDFGVIDNAYKFNMLKYLLRGGKKAGNSELQDMMKIREYCDRYVEKLRGE